MKMIGEEEGCVSKNLGGSVSKEGGSLSFLDWEAEKKLTINMQERVFA